ncbi:TldD/PmbA family protein [Isachenkonia alkalipeptolytica]|uniref:TldD/PmbA family protein n=1 Tax=Isachenkonia alkalipeptolytica TaxID=2565777 RepID=A0AA43XJA2_9CLOT|nr:TldD/PmbA family protein [Isachenkonia alkalipeptolytica]NBG87279.1 TldD/PmbA family protein [Isachenkonia alkalipeptolytica]
MRQLLNKALSSADGGEVYKRDIQSTSVDIKLGKLKDIKSEKKREVSLRLTKNGLMGTSVSTSLEDDTLVDRALIALENQKSHAVDFPNELPRMVFSFSPEVDQLSTEDLTKMAFDLSDRLKEKAPEIPTGVRVHKNIKRVSLLNSAGFNETYDYSNLSLSINTLTDKGFMGVSKEYSSGKVPEITDGGLDRLIHRHHLGNKKITMENEKMPVIFSGNVMGALMLRVIGGVNGGNVLKGTSPLKDKIEEKLFSEKITIRDDGKMAFGVNTCLFDDEGTPSKNTLLYEKGVLKNYLVNIEQGKKLNQEPTGNALKRTLFSKEIEDTPSVFDTNLIIEGDHREDELIVKDIKRGLLITGVMGAHTGNINRGDFSLNISSGYLIENGELQGQVKGAMIAGNIYDLFQNVEAIGTHYEVMRSIFYHMGYSPMVLFKEASIVGK